MELFIPVLIAILYGPIGGFSLEVPGENGKTDLFYYSTEDPGTQLQLYCMNEQGSYIYSMTASVGSENVNNGNPSRPIRKATFDNFIESSPPECIRESVSVSRSTFSCLITETAYYSRRFNYKVVGAEGELNIWNADEQSCFKDNMNIGDNMKDIFQSCDKESSSIGAIFANATTYASGWDYGNRDEQGRLCVCGDSAGCDSFVGAPEPSVGWRELFGALRRIYGEEIIEWVEVILR